MFEVFKRKRSKILCDFYDSDLYIFVRFCLILAYATLVVFIMSKDFTLMFILLLILTPVLSLACDKILYVNVVASAFIKYNKSYYYIQMNYMCDSTQAFVIALKSYLESNEIVDGIGSITYLNEMELAKITPKYIWIEYTDSNNVRVKKRLRNSYDLDIIS